MPNYRFVQLDVFTDRAFCGNPKFVIEQGDFIHRPSRINLDVKGDTGTVEEGKVGGPAVLVAKGDFFSSPKGGLWPLVLGLCALYSVLSTLILLQALNTAYRE